MKNLRLKQTTLSLLIVLSLLTYSVAACPCSHHQEKTEAGAPPCHQNQMDEMPMPEENFAAFETAADCVCMQSAPRIFAKSEIVKIEKQTAAVLPNVVVSIKLNAPVTTARTVDFAQPFYLSDSFYNIKSPRAPPVL